MRPLSLILALIAGVGLGIAQFRMTKRLIKKPNMGLAVAKLPLWALPMLAVASFSVFALLALTAGASATYFVFFVVEWRKMRKGDGN